MALPFIRCAIGAATCGTALALSLSGMPVVTVHGIARPSAAGARWLTVDAKHHAVSLRLIASYSGANGGLNFNGHYNGKNDQLPAYRRTAILTVRDAAT